MYIDDVEVAKEAEIPKLDEYWLKMIESGLALEPLLQKPEWFDEEHPVELTIEMLKTVPEIGEDNLKRQMEQYNKALTDGLNPTEVLNPYRANNLSKFQIPAISIFGMGDLSKPYEETVQRLIGEENIPVIKDRVSLLNKIIAEGKNNPKLKKELEERVLSGGLTEEKKEEYQSTIDRINEAPVMNRQDFMAVYSLGRLLARIIRERFGMDLPEESPGQLLTEVLGREPAKIAVAEGV